MTSKAPKTGNTELDVWLQDIRYKTDNTVKGIFFPVSKSGIIGNYVHGKHPTKLLVAADSAYFGFVVPHEISAVKEVTIRFIPTTSGSLNYTVNTSYGGIGEDENQNSGTLSVTNKSVTDDQLMEIDITSLFGLIDADDQVGVEFYIDSLTTTTNLQILGLYFKYI